MSDYSQPVRTEYDAAIPRMFDPTAGRVHLDAVMHKASLLNRYGKKASRRWPLIIRQNTKTTAELTYILPGGYALAAVPLAKEFTSPFGTVKIDVRTGEGGVTVKQELEIFAQRIEPKDYKAFREYCLNVDDWENDSLILQKLP